MASLRYVGTATWSRTVLKDDGSFERFVAVRPGDTVNDLDSAATDKLADVNTPRSLRNFVVANSSEDPYKNNQPEVEGAVAPAPKVVAPKVDEKK